MSSTIHTTETVTKKKRFRRAGKVTNAEKAFVGGIVADQPREMDNAQIAALATVMRRPRAVVKSMVADAKEQFNGAAVNYVEMHLAATVGALSSGDFETVTKATQWAMTNISDGATRIVDKAAEGAAPAKVVIGIQLGGIPSHAQLPDIAVLPTPGNDINLGNNDLPRVENS